MKIIAVVLLALTASALGQSSASCYKVDGLVDSYDVCEYSSGRAHVTTSHHDSDSFESVWYTRAQWKVEQSKFSLLLDAQVRIAAMGLRTSLQRMCDQPNSDWSTCHKLNWKPEEVKDKFDCLSVGLYWNTKSRVCEQP